MLSKVKGAVFDKTGTLTAGKPAVTDVVQVKQTVSTDGAVSYGGQGMLALAATAENYSEHPLAKAIMEHTKAAGIELGDISDFAAIPAEV